MDEKTLANYEREIKALVRDKAAVWLNDMRLLVETAGLKFQEPHRSWDPYTQESTFEWWKGVGSEKCKHISIYIGADEVMFVRSFPSSVGTRIEDGDADGRSLELWLWFLE